MEFSVWLSFVMVSIVIVISPGIVVAHLISQSMAHGKKAALPLSAGIVLGDGACLVASVAGVGALIVAFPQLGHVIKFVGAGYLIYLGIDSLRSKPDDGSTEPASGDANTDANAKHYNPKKLFASSFVLTFLHPKGILFFSAFLPQFISKEHSWLGQVAIFGLTFMSLALMSCLTYCRLFAYIEAMPKAQSFKANFHYVNGVVLIGLGVFMILH